MTELLEVQWNVVAGAEMTIDALVRSVAVNRNRPLCLLLGAGASVSSGMPSAQRCIWEWKRDIFATKAVRKKD